MLTYEECKAIAIKTSNYSGCKIVDAYKMPGAYMFDNPDYNSAGGLPIVIDTSKGEIHPWFPYVMENNIYPKDTLRIDFETGEEIGGTLE